MTNSISSVANLSNKEYKYHYMFTRESERVEEDFDENFDIGRRIGISVDEAGMPKDAESLRDIDLVTSLADIGRGGVGHTDNMYSTQHYPVIDIDIPIKVVPSSTPGHSHLYINTMLSYREYYKLLTVLAELGIVEWGYLYVFEQRGYSAVRPPWIKKKGYNTIAKSLTWEPQEFPVWYKEVK